MSVLTNTMARAYLNEIEGEGELVVRRTRYGIFIRGTWISQKLEAEELIDGGTYLYTGPIRNRSHYDRGEVKVRVENFR